MNNSNPKFEIGLNIYLVSFTLPKDIVKQLDEVRVSITTMPDGIKQHFHLMGKKMHKTNHVFSLNINNHTKRIVMVFRKKNLFTDGPIIASKTIHLSEFLKLPEKPITAGTINSDVKTLNLFYPLQKQMEEEQTYSKHITRKVLGQMDIQLSFTSPFLKYKKDKTCKDNNKKSKMQSKKGNEYEKISDENGEILN